MDLVISGNRALIQRFKFSLKFNEYIVRSQNGVFFFCCSKTKGKKNHADELKLGRAIKTTFLLTFNIGDYVFRFYLILLVQKFNWAIKPLERTHFFFCYSVRMKYRLATQMSWASWILACSLFITETQSRKWINEQDKKRVEMMTT